jgi:hypothetical protein
MNEMSRQCASEMLYCFDKWGADRAVMRRKSATEVDISLDLEGCDVNSSSGRKMNHYSTTEIVASALDLDAVVQASQKLSSMLDTKDLLRSALGLIMDNTGSTKVHALATIYRRVAAVC